jgi:2-methylisocitrate lyase-like PEP mutase family enzyme
MDPEAILRDDHFSVPRAPASRSERGVAWLRSTVVRFSEGADHHRRRRLVDAQLANVDPDVLRRPGDHVATLASALGLPRQVVRDVRIVAASYQPHTEISPQADAATTRLVDACGGRWDEHTANLIGLLVQACDATAALIAGLSPPVASTRRIGPAGDEILIDLATTPFGAGRHACPGREHALALADGATLFRRLHDGPGPLVLPNAWDVASAVTFVQEGFAAVGTTSLGIAAAIGVRDALGLARDATMTLASSLVRLPVPITVDIETGWDDDPGDLAAELSGMGVAGVNIEDGRAGGLAEAGEQALRIQALKRGAPALFVNARIDTYWLGIDTDTTLDRARRYVAAGADGIFVPGLTDDDVIASLVETVEVPLNLLAGRDPQELAALGVRRISTGSLLYRTALTAARKAAISLRDGNQPGDVLPYGHVDGLATIIT